ncbi:MAG: two-component system alkaline phosphatase synthesis response regulator PhoP [Bacteroidia bacterium]|jgi:two-component system alkaline phosphatase synthesis response regulator PhoP
MGKKVDILIVDDEQDILDFLEYNLKKEGFSVATANSGNKALEVAVQLRPDLILMDVMMPERDGIETCVELREMREMQNTIIAFLTARNEDYSQIAGFEAGADDYITKPIKPRVLVSRVKALLRRGADKGAVSSDRIEIDGLKIDLDRYTVEFNSESLDLPKKEFELLVLFASRPGHVFNRDTILSRVWGDDVVVGERTIDVHVRKLREKFGNKTIKTIKGVGYKFELEAE